MPGKDMPGKDTLGKDTLGKDSLGREKTGGAPTSAQRTQQLGSVPVVGLGQRLGGFFTWPWLPWTLCLAYYIAQPPLQWPLGGWISCVLFAIGVHQRESCRRDGFSRRELLMIWSASSAMWLAMLQGIRLAFWPLTAGWIALSLYLAIYIPIAFVIATSLRLRFRFPLPLACAVAWTTCELIRSYMLTGFAGCTLAHSQTPWPVVLPLASHFGGYGVGFMMMLAGGWLVERVVEFRAQIATQGEGEVSDETSGRNEVRTRTTSSAKSSRSARFFHSATSFTIALWLSSSILGVRARDAYIEGQKPIKSLGRFLLVQDMMPTMFEATQELVERGWAQYERTTRSAAQDALQNGPVDLVIWPESVFAGSAPYMIWDGGPNVPSQLNMDREKLDVVYRNLSLTHRAKLQRLSKVFDGRPPKFLMGTDVWNVHDGELERYNAALWIDPDQRIATSNDRPSSDRPSSDRPSSDGPGSDGLGKVGTVREGSAKEAEYYAKNHLVMFGEYIPILSWIPGAMQALGLGELASGGEPKAWKLGNGTRVAPSVCFEDFVPHLMQSHVQRLIRSGNSPDVLINISNDGWFRGSSILDHHFNSAILTAVENRMPLLVVSNTGITAWVDGDGRVVKRLPKMEAGWIVAEPIPDGRVGWWAWWGDIPIRGIAVIGMLPCLSWCLRRMRSRPN